MAEVHEVLQRKPMPGRSAMVEGSGCEPPMPPADAADSERPVKQTAASRVLALLGAFSHGNGSLTLTEISRRAGLSLPTTYRLAHEVLAWGGLELDDTGRYRLSRKILDLASSSTRALDLRERALPHLMDLHRRTGLNVQLAVRDGFDVMYLEALRAHPNYTGENRIGGRLRLHVSATGHVLLAYAQPGVVDEYVRRPLKRYTDNTITDPAALRRRLDEVRRQRYAVAEGCLVPGAGSVAAPISGEDGSVETAIGVIYRNGQYDPAQLVDLVRATANRISHALAERHAPLDPRTIDFNRREAGLI